MAPCVRFILHDRSAWRFIVRSGAHRVGDVGGGARWAPRLGVQDDDLAVERQGLCRRPPAARGRTVRRRRSAEARSIGYVG